MAAALAHLEARLGPDADHLLDRIRRRVPGRGRRAGAGDPAARGAAPDPGREREPGHRRAARAGRRPGARRGDPLPRRHRRSRGRLRGRPAQRRQRRLADRAHPHAGTARPDLPRRPAPLRPRAVGRLPRRGPRPDSPVTSTSRSASWPTRSAGSISGSAAAGTAVVVAVTPAVARPRPRRSSARPTSRRRSRSTRRGCRRSSSMAKSTYVWLDQLSRTYGREIRTLDAIPDEELATLARWGVTGLWLIGLWERSHGIRADQAHARQRGRGRVGLLARRLPHRRRSRWRDGLRGPARPGVAARDPARERHGPQPHGHRLELGHRPSRVVPVALGAALPGLHVRRAGPVARSARRDRPRGPLLG